MSLEVDASNPSVKARSFAQSGWRERIPNLLTGESDFYDQLFQFRIPESGGPDRVESKAVAGNPLAAMAAPESDDDRETDERRQAEENESVTAEKPSNPIHPTLVSQDSPVEIARVLSTSEETRSTAEQDPRIVSDPEIHENSLRDPRDLENVRANKDAFVETAPTVERETPDSISVSTQEKTTAMPSVSQRPVERREKEDREPTQTSQRQIPVEQIKEVSPEKYTRKELSGSVEEKIRPRIDPEGSPKDSVPVEQTANVSSVKQFMDSTQKERRERSPVRIEPKPAGLGPYADEPTKESSEGTRSVDPSNQPKFEPVNATNGEYTRVRRRNERNVNRNRFNNDRQSEATDRSAPSDRQGNARFDVKPASSLREIASTKTADPSLGSSNLPSNTVNTSVVASASQPTPTAPVTGTRTAGSAPSEGRSVSVGSQVSTNSSSNNSVPSATSLSSPSPNAPASTVTAGSSGTKLSHYQETKLVQRVIRGMEQLSNGGGQVRLRLHPPELGSLQMTLRIEGNAVFAELQVETTSARDTLLKNLPVLKERLAEQGMQVERFEVRTDLSSNQGNFNASSEGRGGDGDSGSNQQNSRSISELRNRLSPRDVASTQEPVRRWTRTLGQLDFQA